MMVCCHFVIFVSVVCFILSRLLVLYLFIGFLSSCYGFLSLSFFLSRFIDCFFLSFFSYFFSYRFLYLLFI